MSLNKAIGGYFELELPNSKATFHTEGFNVNSGRNAFKLLLQALEVEKVYLAYYTCDAVLDAIQILGLRYAFYPIDKNFMPAGNMKAGENEALIYTNYFGLCDEQVKVLAATFNNCIIDNAQAFYSMPEMMSFPSFYSPRKFFGVPDGGFAYSEGAEDLYNALAEDTSIDHCVHLLKRWDISSEAGYEDFKASETAIAARPMKKMSKLTEAILNSIDFEKIRDKRTFNFGQLHQQLKEVNELSYWIPDEPKGPMVYPFLVRNGDALRKYLQQQRIYTATYWPNVKDWIQSMELPWEKRLVDDLVALPIDQRLQEEDVARISNAVLNFYHA